MLLYSQDLATQNSNLKEFQVCLTMLGNWSKYILNAFDCNYTNGYTEGTDNVIKVIKRMHLDIVTLKTLGIEYSYP